MKESGMFDRSPIVVAHLDQGKFMPYLSDFLSVSDIFYRLRHNPMQFVKKPLCRNMRFLQGNL
jgi:hypothetical protein